jgi:methyl-accepting chemotaxis protein
VERTSIATKLLGGLLVVDIVMGMFATFIWLADVDINDVTTTVLLCAAFYVVHSLLWAVPALQMMASLRVWELRGPACTSQELLAADSAVEILPVRIALSHGLAWLVYFGGLFFTAHFLLPELWSFGAPERAAMSLAFVAFALGPPVVIYPIASLLLQNVQTQIGAEVGRHALEQSRDRAPLEKRMVLAAVCLVLTFVFWLSASAWYAHGEAARQIAGVQVLDAAHDDANAIAAGASDLLEADALVTDEQLPPLLAAQIADTVDGRAEISIIDKNRDRVLAAAAVGDGRWVIAEAHVAFDTRSLWIRLVVDLLMSLVGTGLMIFAMARLLTTPLVRLRLALQRVTEAGVLSEIGRIPVVRRDEIGELTTEFNHMLDVFDELASAARAVTTGNLQVEIRGPGDLQDSFRAMVARLAELVMQIREAALEVASATAEIHAATYEQERAVGHQSDEIHEVSIAIARLAESATDISKEAGEVLSNAEQTRKRADEVVGEIAELGRHITRVGELLELIRDVADRSDLLALNGSLEATRAGEAGRGFALVATEMRRLAERVTGTVADVRATVAAIGTSNSATVDATKDSRELAGSTTQAARRIVDVIHTQGTETELVSSAARAIADAVASSAAAITQTRASADGLRERAERLERLIQQFDVSEPALGRAGKRGHVR